MPARMIRLLLLIVFLFPLTLQATNVRVVEVKGGIGPASQDLIISALRAAEKNSDSLLVLELDTPGGLSDSMRDIVRAILASKVPVVTYVSPQGARAASAGTYIMYASHLSAMAPATNLGAATPVNISSPVSLPLSSSKDDSAMDRKVVNDAVAYIRGLAEKRNRNADWAEVAVRAGETLTATAAMELGVIDFVAADLESLLDKINGSQVEVAGVVQEIVLDDITLQRVSPDWRQEILARITDPTIAYVLMLLGIYGLIFELSNPGAILPGVVGAVALMLALYAFHVLPVSSAGLALTVVGLFFIIAELFVTSGVLGLGGVIAFVVGSIMLFDDRHLAVSLPLIGGIALVAAGFLLWVLTRVVKIRNAVKISGREAMIEARARVIEWSEGKGRVRYEGESWIALSESPLKVGQHVVIKRVDELSLSVEPVKELKND